MTNSPIVNWMNTYVVYIATFNCYNIINRPIFIESLLEAVELLFNSTTITVHCTVW